LKILGHQYSIRLADPGVFDDLGRVNHGALIIQLRKDMNDDAKLSTLIHEIVHSIDFQLSTDMDEKNVCRMATGIYQVFVDNGIDLSPLLRGVK
jgi:hypothetical protein